MLFQSEFQAVILAAGRGSRMPEITSGKPKCLLPVGTKPLIYFPLLKLQQSGFTDVIVVVLESQKNEIQCAVERNGLEIKIDYFPINGNEDFGTADSLRLLNDKLKSDVVVVSCDFITDTSLKGVLDIFRMNNASAALLFLHPTQGDSVAIPGPKSKHKPEKDLIGIDTQTSRLVFMASASDFETEVTVPKALLRKHTHIKMYSNLVDAHVYVLKNWVIKYLASQSNVSTLKGELLPHVVKKQLSKMPQSSAESKSIVTPQDTFDIFNFAKEDQLDLLIRETSAFNDHVGDLKDVYHGDSIRCYAFVADKPDFGVRINTLPAYWAINNEIMQRWSKITNDLEIISKHPKATIQSNQVDDKCIIWDGAKLDEKTSFKNSIIGANSHVSKFSRVFNSIIMNNVDIAEKVAVENCIISDGAIIETGCQLKGCLVGSNHKVPEHSDHSQEVLADQLMEF